VYLKARNGVLQGEEAIVYFKARNGVLQGEKCVLQGEKRCTSRRETVYFKARNGVLQGESSFCKQLIMKG
jgi:hypothetical protein